MRISKVRFKSQRRDNYLVRKEVSGTMFNILEATMIEKYIINIEKETKAKFDIWGDTQVRKDVLSKQWEGKFLKEFCEKWHYLPIFLAQKTLESYKIIYLFKTLEHWWDSLV